MSESEERMTVATVDICSCGTVMHQLDDDDYDTLGSASGVCCADCGNEQFTTIKDLQAELATAKKEHRWIPVGELPPRDKSYHHSKWYVLTDGKDWTIGYYDFPFKRWSKGHSPFDLPMAAITHYRSPTLPEGE